MAFSAAGSIVTSLHQQACSVFPAAIPHWLSAPHKGQVFNQFCVVVICCAYSAVLPEAIITDSWRGVSMANDEEKGFIDEMADVVPLKREPRVAVRGRDSAERDTSQELRRQAAERGLERDRNNLTEGAVVPLDSWYVLDFKRPGVQNGVFRKLKQGRYETDARLDLHRMTTTIARRELFWFLEEAIRLGLRTVLIIHGKGQTSAEKERSSILKGCTEQWLRELDMVQAFHSAQPRHGGTGAVYVLLRKSEEMKRENRERFSKGRVPIEPE